MARSLPLLVAFLLVTPIGRAGEEDGGGPPDTFAMALEAMGVGVEDLGYRPKATWSRYPHPSRVPYVLSFFEDLHANPLDTYEFTRTLGNAVEDQLTPEKLRGDAAALYRLGVALGTERLAGGFRGYGANLDPRPEAREPLRHALIRLLDRSRTRFARDMTFGKPADWSDDPWLELAKDVAAVPESLHLPLAKLVLSLIDAREWIDRGLRRVPAELRRAVFSTLPWLAESTGDGTRFAEAVEDAAALLDAPSLYYGGLKALQSVQDARLAIGDLDPPAFAFHLRTDWGDVRLSAGGAESHDTKVPPLLLVRFDRLEGEGSLGATTPDLPLSVALVFGNAVIEAEAVARGVLGAGIVLAAGDGEQGWKTERWGLGAGLLGMGVLADEGGDDSYHMRAVGQGAGYLGVGLLLDAAGKDEYRLAEGDGQGLGFPGGVGVLADRSGDDSYYAEPDAAKAGRADYHSKDKVAVSNAQGVGSGRRGDGSDGHVWAGGLGVLLDVEGDDVFRAGNFSQGLGYWYGTGLLWDGGGDDEYRSVYFTQGSGAHFAIGALIDEGGNDRHLLEENAGAAFGFGWDFVNAILLDRGSGNDRYEAKIISTGLAEVRSNAFFIDEGGDDVYVLDAGTKGLGDVDQRKTYDEPGRTSAYFFHAPQIGVFLDLGGSDEYLRRSKDGTTVPHDSAGDGKTWNVRRRDPAVRAGPNLSVGMDVPAGRLGFLDPWPARTVPTPAEDRK